VIANAVDRSSAFWLGAGVTLGTGQRNVQVARTKVRMVGRAGEGTALTYGLAYTYPLSKSAAPRCGRDAHGVLNVIARAGSSLTPSD